MPTIDLITDSFLEFISQAGDVPDSRVYARDMDGVSARLDESVERQS